MLFQVIQKKRQRKTEITASVQRNEIVLFPGSGGSSRLESVGEDDELFMENGLRSCEVVEKAPPGRRKHSLPQQLDTSGVRQVSKSLTLFFIPLKV